ncbi:protein MODIFIER OF SNC1 1 [Prunus yedoensis var. nudiflora]|uniref:Protein MODIFIER OF SNC1 1 n=1 Tax=Prunus yedoensis var. nudiflora TaxID=2094558 RepID=A0A314Y251_PRUYE|nr:protein MODIFIER OF SNC1 1 [Prunus yedoensis var. nudiflora]
MTSSMLLGDRRLNSSSRRGPMTVLGKVPKPVNLPSQRLENHGRDPNVEIVPKGTLGWGSRSSSASNAWGSPSLSPKADGGTSPSHLSGTSPSHLSGHLSSGSGTRPSTAGSEKAHEPSSNAWGPSSRPSSASGALTSNQTSLTSLRPRSAETRPGSSQLSRFAEHSEHPVAWSAPGTAEKLSVQYLSEDLSWLFTVTHAGVLSTKNDGFSLSSGDFPTLGSEKDNPGNNAKSQDHSSYCRPGSSSGDRVAKETTGTSLVGDVSANAHVKSGTANSFKRENPSYSGDGGRPGMEKWQGNPHPYPSANVPPQHYDGWHGGPVTNPQGGVWYRGPPGAAPYGTPVPPGGFPMEPFPYYPPQIPPAALANAQPVPPPGAGPRGHHPKNGDMYRAHMQDAYIRPGMPIRPGFYPGPVPYEGYYPSPMGYCNPNERDVPFVGMAAGPPVYNRYPSQSAHEPGNSHGRPSGYGPTNQAVMSEQLESGHPHESRGPYKVLLKQHDNWDRRNEEQRNEGAGGPTKNVGIENDWRSEHRKEEERDQRKVLGEETASQNFDNRGACSVPMKVAPESLGNIKAADVISVKKLGTEASGTPEVGQPQLAAAKDSSLIQKIEGLNAKARVSDGRNDTASVSSREEQKNRFQVNAKANHSVNERGSSFVNPERSHATEIVNPSHEVGFSAGDKNQETAGSGISISRRSNQGMHSRSDHRGRGRLNNQEGEGWWKKSLVSEPTTVYQDHLATMEATEKSGSYPEGRHEEESATPLLDPNDSEAQRAKMKELAKQRSKQLEEEEEERTRRQKAKALAKLEELNRRTQVVEGSNEKFAKLEELNRSSPVVEGSNEKYEEEEERTRGQTPRLVQNWKS